MIFIKNTTLSNKTWAGQVVLPSAYYEIQVSELNSFSENITVLADIFSGEAIISSTGDVSGDITDINLAVNFIKQIEGIEVDSEGRQVTRIAAGKKGWVYMAHPIEMTTSTVGGCYSTDYTGTARTDFDMKLYKADGTEITDQGVADTDCVKTILTFKPLYDYEIISGNIFQSETTTEDIRIWAIGGALAVASNTPVSVKEFASGINMKFIGNDDHIETDGRASKKMTKDLTAYGLPFPTYQGNCFQFIVTHPAGIKHDIMTVLEYFRG